MDTLDGTPQDTLTTPITTGEVPGPPRSIKELSVLELKAIAFDQIMIKEQAQQILNSVLAELDGRK